MVHLICSSSQSAIAFESIGAFVLLCSNSFSAAELSSRVSAIRDRRTVYFVVVVCSSAAIIFMTMQHSVTPIQLPTMDHPIQHLIHASRFQFQDILSKQSTTLAQAVEEYISRTGMHPPPHFDVWYEFARSKNVQLIDEYDTITQLLKPFWGVTPATIRANARNILGAEKNEFPGIVIRNGKVGRTEGLAPLEETHVNSIREMMKSFAHHLPDMDLVINTKHEPSIVTPHNALGRYVRDAGKYRRPQVPQNHFSRRPVDLLDVIPLHAGSNVFEVNAKTAWSSMTQSCPINSAARDPNGLDFVDSFSYRGFIYNTTAFADICNQPSLSRLNGILDRPATLLYSSTLSPVFSVSKLSSFNDILIPSPAIYSEETAFANVTDINWDDKIDQLFWRGESSNVQRILAEMKQLVLILKNVNNQWIMDTIFANEAESLFNVEFTTTPNDTEAAISAQETTISEEIRKWKYLLNIDGPGESSPDYYTLLTSQSTVFKSSILRSWSDEFLWPWVHYVPLGMDGGDWYESVRYFAREESGKLEGKVIATESREWASKVLRKEDMEAWMFRLLLEYVP